MIPSLFTFTILTSLVLFSIGLPVLLVPDKVEPCARQFPRHRMAGIITMLLGGGWFLWKISQLGQADFGDYKKLLFLLFAGVLIGSIFYVRDFLAVRGMAILVLLFANLGLKSAFGHYDIPERLLLVIFLYLFIVAALIYGTLPFKGRDTIDWLFARIARARMAGGILALMGAVLLLSVFFY